MKKGYKKETIHSRDKDVGWVGLCRRNGRWSFKGPLKYIYERILRWNKINGMHVQLLRANIFTRNFKGNKVLFLKQYTYCQ
jgi:hypothetical protein